MSHTIPHIRVLLLLNRCGWKQFFSKMYVYARKFVQCYTVHYVIKVLTLLS